MNALSILIKPASSLCNMRCKYCFYHDVADHRKIQSFGFMEKTTADILIKESFEYVNHKGAINFMFQGGEPTLAGMEFFENFTNTVDEHNRNNIPISYSIQTNGQVIDARFCKLFKKYNFLVGLSQDGPKAFHDANRIDADLQGTYDKTNDAIALFDSYGVEYNILSVITRQMADNPDILFHYYKRKNLKYIQLIPCLNPQETIASGESSKETKEYELTPNAYGYFLKEIFNLWYDELAKGNYISIRLFDNLVHMLKGRRPEQCGLTGACTIQCVVESDGGVYPCDFYVLDDFKLGNIYEEKLIDMFESDTAKAFLEYEELKHPLCNTCEVYSLCCGGCKRYRSFYRQNSKYCSYQDFLYNALGKLQIVSRLVD